MKNPIHMVFPIDFPVHFPRKSHGKIMVRAAPAHRPPAPGTRGSRPSEAPPGAEVSAGGNHGDFQGKSMGNRWEIPWFHGISKGNRWEIRWIYDGI